MKTPFHKFAAALFAACLFTFFACSSDSGDGPNIESSSSSETSSGVLCAGEEYNPDIFRCEFGELVGKCGGRDFFPAYQVCESGVIKNKNESSSSEPPPLSSSSSESAPSSSSSSEPAPSSSSSSESTPSSSSSSESTPHSSSSSEPLPPSSSSSSKIISIKKLSIGGTTNNVGSYADLDGGAVYTSNQLATNASKIDIVYVTGISGNKIWSASDFGFEYDNELLWENLASIVLLSDIVNTANVNTIHSALTTASEISETTLTNWQQLFDAEALATAFFSSNGYSSNGDYCYWAANNCWGISEYGDTKTPAECEAKSGTVVQNCSNPGFTEQYCDWGACVNGNEWDCEEGGCYAIPRNADPVAHCTENSGAIVSACPIASLPPAASGSGGSVGIDLAKDKAFVALTTEGDIFIVAVDTVTSDIVSISYLKLF